MLPSDQSHYNKNLKQFARSLRNDSTKGEIILWKEPLGNRKMLGLQFLRQYPIENYIADFICRKIRLIIEIDGYSHNNRFEKDLARDTNLKKLDYTILRFEEQEVCTDLNNVIRVIECKVGELLDQSPRPPSPRRS